MSFLGKVFGGDSDVVDRATDAIIKAGDAIVFTDEEKSMAAQKKLDWFLLYVSATNPQNVSRRALAWIVGGLWAGLIIVMVIARALGYDAFSDYVFDVLRDQVTIPFGVIMTFYFAAHALRASK